jgi:4-diphosphocytidyl-2-C-methyl-D-erythritol kinase
MCTVGFFDVLEISPATEPGLQLVCDRKDLPTDATNLIVRAGAALLKAAQISRGANVVLSKNIPMGGGLGGGSSNAATALIGLDKSWNLNLGPARLHELATSLGSDVPFFLHGPSSVCTGHGEHVVPIASPAARWVILIFPELAMPTPAVYRRFDAMKLGSRDAIENQPDWAHWTGLASDKLLPLLVNDLEAPAFAIEPKLGRLREQLEQSLGRIVRMSGSGSTLFTLADEKSQAENFAGQIRDAGIKASAVPLAPLTGALDRSQTW